MNLKDSFIFSIKRLNRCVTQEVDACLSDNNMSTWQLLTLMAIKENPEANSNQISFILGTDICTFSRRLSTLKKAGLITRKKREDNGRCNFIGLTAKGKLKVDKVSDALEAIDKKLAESYADYFKVRGKK